MDDTVAVQLVTVLATGTVLVALCQRFSLSPILGYLLTGVLLGPSLLNWLPEVPSTRLLAELGVVLLMFTIGLEFSVPRIFAARRLVLGLGGLQVLSSTALLAFVVWWWGLALTEALLLGVALAMSSTAIVLKHLGEQLELTTAHGRVSTAILLFQDIAAVAALVALPVVALGPAQLGTALGLALGKAVAVFLCLAYVGTRLLPSALHWVAATRSLELFMLSTLLLAAAAAGLSSVAGLSPTLGAFMAGMLLGETQFRHQIETDIRPFRDLMLGLFFITIGMQLDVTALIESPGRVAMVFVALVLAKPLILVPLVLYFGQTAREAWRASLGLAQGGELGLLLVSSGLALGVLEGPVAQPVLGGLILSMFAAPLLLRYNQALSALVSIRRPSTKDSDVRAHIAEMSRDYDRHVIVCGYGRMGQNLMRILSDMGLPALALDLDPERVRQAAAAGEPVMFGSAIQPGVLRAAGIERALALALTVDDAALAERVVSHVRSIGLEVPILVRGTRGRDEESLLESGATVFPEGLEISLAFAGQLLAILEVPHSEVEAQLNAIRANDYALLRVFFHATTQEKANRQSMDYPEEMRALIVGERHAWAGRNLQELQLEQFDVELVDVLRGAIRMPGRLLDTRLRSGDVLLLKGAPAALERATAMVVEGG